MKVLSCNVNGRVRAALDRQMARLLARKPDIVVLQEVTMGSYAAWCRGLTQSGYSVASSVDLVARPYPPGPYATPPFPPRRGRQIERKYFNLTAARHPIAMLPGLTFDDPDEAKYAFPEKYLAVRITVGGDEIDVHNAHLPPGASRGVVKVHAFEAIRRRVDKGRGSPSVLCGDFNAPWSEDAKGPVTELKRNWPADIKARWIEAETRVVANPRLRDVYRDVHDPGMPFPASHHTKGTPHRYDHIFASSDLETKRCEYLVDWLEGDDCARRLSDHAPAEAELSLVSLATKAALSGGRRAIQLGCQTGGERDDPKHVTASVSTKLYINHVAEYDWLIALEFGRVNDAQPPDNWRGVSEHFGYLHDGPGGRALGFKVLDFSEFDPEAQDVTEIWGEPLFDVPLLGLGAVPAGEVVLATLALLGEEATINRAYFSEAIGTEDPEEALPLWLACLESGDSMAHFALGYTLYELGRFPEAYRHLRHYTEIAPHGSWNWCWFGKGAEAVGEKEEAIAAYERALELEADGDQETDATERLKELVGLDGMVRIRERLNEKTDGRVGLYSSAEHYSGGPAAKVILSHQYDEDAPVECAACGWSGPARDGDVNHFEELFDVCCPSCDKMLLVVNTATPGDEGKG